MNKLIIADDEGKTTVVPLVRDEITIGRKEGNTIRLTERNVSRRHARLLRSNGAFLLEDLESYNGVSVNGESLSAPRKVADGDKITIGDYQLSLRSDRPTGPRVGPALDEEPPPYARLVMLGPPNPGQEFALEKGELVIGRTDENAIVINHRSISRAHAKIVVGDTGYRLVDLDSANGVRVNNTDFSDTELTSGDLVELGTVRLRFVGAGELYQFDADATVQMDAVPEDVLEGLDEKKPVLPIIVAVAVVALIGAGVALAVYFGTSGSGDVEAVVAPPPLGGTPPEPPSPAAAAAAGAGGIAPAKRLEMAREYFEQQRFEESVATLDGLGAALPPEARDLRARAVAEQDAQTIWARACNRADPNDLHTIHSTCKQIPADSHYAGRACCEGIGARFGQAQLASAKLQKRNREHDQATALLEGIVADAAVPQGVRDEARELLDRWAAAAPRDQIAKAPATAPRPPETKAPAPGPSKVAAAPNESSESALDRAKAAILRNDQAGCIRALRSAPPSERVVRILIGCYQNSGNVAAACSLAKRYSSMSHARQFAQARCR
jgi:pSer/pThr/pTyr-binding forkhead associated (FHA) protein